eukprot:9622176-Karenia_brevis.AAC.1
MLRLWQVTCKLKAPDKIAWQRLVGPLQKYNERLECQSLGVSRRVTHKLLLLTYKRGSAIWSVPTRLPDA